MMRNPLLLVATLLIAAVGCSKNEDEELPMPVATNVSFDGAPEEKYAGTWKTADGISTYFIDKSGTYKADSVIPMKGQAPMKTHIEGEWKASGEQLLFKDAKGNVVPFSCKLDGDTLELSLTGSMKRKIVMKRQG